MTLDQLVQVVRIEEDSPADANARYPPFGPESTDVPFAESRIAAGHPNCQEGSPRTLLALRAVAHKFTSIGRETSRRGRSGSAVGPASVGESGGVGEPVGHRFGYIGQGVADSRGFAGADCPLVTDAPAQDLTCGGSCWRHIRAGAGRRS